MNDTDDTEDVTGSNLKWFAITASIAALIGLADSIYLTVHHFTAQPVPCSLIEGCEQVLTSSYAEVGGVPLAAFGAAAYFAAFSLAVLTVYGDERMWRLFGVQVTLMAIFSAWLVYVQAAIIGAFCQFCLISAGTTLAMFLIYLASRFLNRIPAQDSQSESIAD